jgi:hypothetical protein
MPQFNFVNLNFFQKPTFNSPYNSKMTPKYQRKSSCMKNIINMKTIKNMKSGGCKSCGH